MLKLRRLLVPVHELRGRLPGSSLKAAQLARATGAEIELFHADDELMDVYALASTDAPETFEAARKRRIRQRLEKMAERLRELQVRVSVHVECDYPAHQAILRRAKRFRADLIVLDARPRHRVPSLLRVTDWELLRHSPVPVLLVKGRARYSNPTILAAVDPQHAFSKPTGLDRAIVAAARCLEDSLTGRLHVLHAYVPIPPAALSSEMLVTPDLMEELRRSATRRATSALQRLVKPLGMPAKREHLVAEHPSLAIPRIARAIGSDIVVMGALSRGGLKRLFIGNTAERVLDELSCDVLVVKPTGFDSEVPSEVRGIHWAVFA